MFCGVCFNIMVILTLVLMFETGTFNFIQVTLIVTALLLVFITLLQPCETDHQV